MVPSPGIVTMLVPLCPGSSPNAAVTRSRPPTSGPRVIVTVLRIASLLPSPLHPLPFHCMAPASVDTRVGKREAPRARSSLLPRDRGAQVMGVRGRANRSTRASAAGHPPDGPDVAHGTSCSRSRPHAGKGLIRTDWFIGTRARWGQPEPGELFANATICIARWKARFRGDRSRGRRGSSHARAAIFCWWVAAWKARSRATRSEARGRRSRRSRNRRAKRRASL